MHLTTFGLVFFSKGLALLGRSSPCRERSFKLVLIFGTVMLKTSFYVIGTKRPAKLIGYARTSTLEHEAGLQAQQQDLQALG